MNLEERCELHYTKSNDIVCVESHHRDETKQNELCERKGACPVYRLYLETDKKQWRGIIYERT